MDDIARETERARGPLHELSGLQGVDLPLVSIIVINYNYGRFLPAAVDSALRQSYPRIEIIVVENGSTDDSAEVLRGIVTRTPEVKSVELMPNRGQSGAALAGLAEAQGAYVVFLDADDLLLPHAVTTHIYVHLSLRIHVGFTCGDMMQLVGDQVVLGTEDGFSRGMRKEEPLDPARVRPFRPLEGVDWPRGDVESSVLERLRIVKPTWDWVWSPTSGNCFRRDALDLFTDKPELPQLVTGTDLYLCLGINAVTGSVLIDAPVAVYRIHGSNVFTRRAQLNHVLAYNPSGDGIRIAQGKAYVVDHLIDRAERFVGHGWDRFDYLRLLRRIDCGNPDESGPAWARRSRAASGLVRRYREIAPVVGPKLLAGFLIFGFGVPWTKVLRLAFAK